MFVSFLDVVSSAGSLSLETNPVISFLGVSSTAVFVLIMVLLKSFLVGLIAFVYGVVRFSLYSYLLFLIVVSSILTGHFVIVMNNFNLFALTGGLLEVFLLLVLVTIVIPIVSGFISVIVFTMSYWEVIYRDPVDAW